jgi:hypothetical protein
MHSRSQAICLGVAGLLLIVAGTRGEPARVEQTADRVTLANRHCRFSLDARTGDIVALEPGPASLRGPWFAVVEEDRAGLAPWETWERGKEATFTGGDASVAGECTAGVARARIRWERPAGLLLEAEAELGPDSPGPRLRLHVNNRTGAALVDTLRFPVLRGVELGDLEDDWFTWPHTLGARFRVRGFVPGRTLEAPYPAFLTMQWLDLHDATQGVYVGCQDDYGWSKQLFIGRDAEGAGLMGITFEGCWIAKAGDCWTTPWVQLVAHGGDWRAGADLYRPWAEAAFGPLDPPERVRELPTAQCWLAHHARDADLGRLFEVQQQAPIHASYLMKSLNTSIPEGWDGFRGSALDLQEACERIRALGGSPALFTFDRAPLMGRPNYADHVGRWTCQRRDLTFCEGFRDLMPSPFAPDLVQARVGEAVRWVRNFGLDEIHLDTAATTGEGLAAPSYHPGFPQRPNEVPHYFKLLYRAIRDGCRQYNPGFLLRAEHCADFFYPEFLTSTAHFFETGNLVASQHPPADAEMLPILLRYTLPRHAALQMPSMSDNDFWTYGYGMGHGFHGGGPSWCFNPGVREAESPPGELLHRYRFYDGEWRRYYDFRVGFAEAVVDAERVDEVATALIDGEWRRCSFPGPVVAVTHSGGGREVTLGQWYHLSRTPYFGQRFVGDSPLEPRPIRLRVPTLLQRPHVRLFGARGAVDAGAQVTADRIEVDIADPTCFALEASVGPTAELAVPPLTHPGQTAEVTLTVKQDRPRRGEATLHLPAGWASVPPVRVPARREFVARVPVSVPPGSFGRNYPLKAVLRSGDLQRTTAAHLRVIEPVTVLYDFDAGPAAAGSERQHALVPGQPAQLTVTCVNNTPAAGLVEVLVSGDLVSGQESRRIAGIDLREIERDEHPLRRWSEGKGEPPANALVAHFVLATAGAPRQPTRIEVRLEGVPVFATQAWPRTRLMDLNGGWRVSLQRRSQANVGGAEQQDNLDVESVTPGVWDGSWPLKPTPIRFEEDVRKASSWGIYRRLVFVPATWRGTDLWLRLGRTGAPWGEGGTLNLVYVNGWPAGRTGTDGECSITPFLVCGGWNLLAIASMSPNCLVEPYLFVRQSPAPERLVPVPPAEPPSGAFLELGERSTGQGLGLVFIAGVAEGDHRRTEVAKGGENVFLYFTVADGFLYEMSGPAEVEVEYLDEGTAPFGLDYDSLDPAAPVRGAFKTAPSAQRTNTGQWRTHIFRLPDARLANRQHQGADFRLAAGGGVDLRVRRVAVRRGSAP